MNKGVRLWDEAKILIPGGNQLLSKRSEMFLPNFWPSYYKKAKGCEIWDLDDNHYFDFACMGVGSCILGYADEDINNKVKEAIDQGSMATLNSYEEVELAKKLISLHPWAQMVRFSRSGGEACAIAVRIARAASRKDIVAFCGYHGWHDWYLSSNLGDASNLDGQLLPGLEPKGVVRNLKESAIPFEYNSLNQLHKIIREHPGQVGVIIMEPVRSSEPKQGFLEGVRQIADEIGAVLIFDEVTSGFRMNLGGVHLCYGVSPDVAVFGKALGNGFAISAVIGKKNIMNAAQETFVSSTFWTERIGFVAALAVIDKMCRHNVQAKLIEYGNMVFKGWGQLAKDKGVPLVVGGIPPLAHFQFIHPDSLVLQTYFNQEMLAKGFLSGSAAYMTYAYTHKIIGLYLQTVEEVFDKIGKCIKNGQDIRPLLKGPVKHAGFKRLN